MAKPNVLVVEDNASIAAQMRSAMEDEFENTLTESTRTTGIRIHERLPKVILVSLKSSWNPLVADPMRILQELRESRYAGKVIAYTEGTQRSLAIRAVQEGACDVLAYPIDLPLLKGVVRRAAYLADLEQEARGGMTGGGLEEFNGMVGTSANILRIFDAIRKVSTSDIPILITGESGTGKELTARAIHDRGLRKHGPFIPINCGGIPENLLESELFGCERGAAGQKNGKVEFAQGGTLFLEEVGELPGALQVKLLRFLQDHSFERAGGHQPIEMDVRIIAATTVNLKEPIERGTFREDLYYRLGGVHINLPPLRERGEDRSLMAMAFLRRSATHYDKHLDGFTREALEAMRVYAWPGNVRELSNRVGRAAVMAEGTHVTPADLDLPHQAGAQNGGSISLKVNQQRIETDLIMKAFTLSQGNLSRAAQELGISRSTLYRRLRQYGMDHALDARRALGASSRTWMTEH